MPITVECGCGARFRVRDELAGRRGKCPKCGQVLEISPAAAPPEAADDGMDDSPPARPAPAAKPAANRPQTARTSTMAMPPGYRSRPRTKEAQVRFAISPRMTLFIAVVIAIPTVIWIVKAGPVSARDQWQVLGPQAERDIEDAIDKTLANREEAAWQRFRESMKDMPPGWEQAAAKTRYVPRVNTLVIDSPTLMWSVPAKVSFQGRISRFMVTGMSATGKPKLTDLRGVYHTKTRRVEGEVELEGTSVKVAARIENGTIVME